MRYRKLRGAFRELDIDYEYLSGKIGISPATISHRMTEKSGCEWSLPEAYAVLKIINQPLTRIHEYFPPGGVA